MRLVSILAEMQKTHINLGFAASSRHQISGRGRSQARDPPEKAKSVQKLLSQVNSILSFQNQLFSFLSLLLGWIFVNFSVVEARLPGDARDDLFQFLVCSKNTTQSQIMCLDPCLQN